MIELALEFFYGLVSVSGGKKGKIMLKPVFVVALVIWLVFILCLTLIFG